MYNKATQPRLFIPMIPTIQPLPPPPRLTPASMQITKTVQL
jgi:hypothetical protein